MHFWCCRSQCICHTERMTSGLSTQVNYLFFQSLVISSSVLPLVSGIMRHTNTAAITQMVP